MRQNSFKYVAVMLMVSIAISQPCAYAASIPSKTARGQELWARDHDLVLARMLFASDRVAKSLAAEGLNPAQIEARLAALTTADLIALGRNPDQLRAAGISMSRRMWTVVGIAAGALVVGGLAVKQNDDGEDEDGSDDGED